MVIWFSLYLRCVGRGQHRLNTGKGRRVKYRNVNGFYSRLRTQKLIIDRIVIFLSKTSDNQSIYLKAATLMNQNSLADALKAVTETGETIDPEIRPAVAAFIDNLKAAAAGRSAPAVGSIMPDFLLPGPGGRLVSLGDYLTRGPVIVTFFRGRWCPYCTLTKTRMDQAVGAAAERRVSLIGVTPERPDLLRSVCPGPSIDVVCDVDNGYALQLGLTVLIGGKLANLYRRLGVDPAADQPGASWLVPIPASFLISADGVILKRHLDVDFRNRLPLEDFIAHLADQPAS
ncbi:peroxiredoxin-like family protein [Maricaulaceae bacterium MS644]